MGNRILTIITINLNNSAGLRKTIESVIAQTFKDFEYIIIDGGSTDDSVEVIKKHADMITYWISEPDKGIYNAMNKGILKAMGEYLLFLNSGDFLVDEKVLEDFCNSELTEDIILGDIYLVDTEIIILQKAIRKEEFGFEHFYFGGSLAHQSMFIKRKLFMLYGLYNENFKIASDLEFLVITLLIKNASYNHFERFISYYDLSGISSQRELDVIHNAERETIFRTHVPLIYRSYKKVCDENAILRSQELYYYEYMNLKKGKFSIFVKLLLFIKRKLRNPLKKAKL